MVSHESLRALLGVARMPGWLGRRVADYANARTAAGYDTVVGTTRWACVDFHRVGARNVVQVPLGVDLETFHPSLSDGSVRMRFAHASQLLLVHCGRLSKEKCPTRSVEALAHLRASGVDAVLVIAGDGPLRARLERQAADLPVHFVDFVTGRRELGVLLATADIALAPGPAETFGLAALEALACGTPVVVDAASALPEVVGGAGVAVGGDGAEFARGVRELLNRGEAVRRRGARAQAERFGWNRSVDGFLAIHEGAR
jgi:alpha-1,6-mannosyltransferase